MHVLHACWIPDEGNAFAQFGDFHLWVESTESFAGQGSGTRHPRSLPAGALQTLLAEMNVTAAPDALADLSLTLPGTDDGPLPCPELGPFLDPLPEAEAMYRPWTVTGWRLTSHPIATLNELHFQTVLQGNTIRPGADFLFWYWFTQSLKALLYKEAFVPSMRLHADQQAGFAVYAGWALLSDGYDRLLHDATERMPMSAAPGYTPRSVLGHCAEVLLHRCVSRTALTQMLEKKLLGTFLETAFRDLHRTPWQTGQDPASYRDWLRWYYKLAGSEPEAGFLLCFQLYEAEAADTDAWQLEFRVAAHTDLSLQFPLHDYWTMGDAARRALTKRFGADFEQALLLRLGQAARIYPALWAGLETAEPAGITLSLEEAFAFLNETAWVLEDAGFRVIVPGWWTPQGRRRAKLRMRGAPTGKKPAAAVGASSLSLESLLNYRYELTLGGETVSPEEWQQLIDAKAPLVRFRGQWVALDRERMREMLAFWKSRGDGEQPLDALELLHRTTEEAELFEVDPADALVAMLARLRDESRLEPIDDPPALNATLRDYQKRGVAWLQLLERLGLSGCLADDMGLGKTIQVIARLVLEKEEGGPHPPTLLIAPTSVIGNWRKELERFAPQLTAHLHHGGMRSADDPAFRAACEGTDVVITSYPLLRKDAKLFAALQWRRVVLDEAQNIKNPLAAQTKAVLALRAGSRLALTGTPVENRLLDLWSIFNFLNPGYLGKQAQFRKQYELPIQRDNNQARSARLRKLVEPFILRRVKTDPAIIRDLPDKVENRQFCSLSREQASLYEAVVRDVERQLEEQDGIRRQGLMLSTLMKLKQVCNHPAQFLQDGSAFLPERSRKLERLLDMLADVLAEGESALVFTQFTDIGDALERQLKAGLQCQTYYLHGGTARNRREQMIERFQDPDSPPAVFILSLKAGGVGITLTRANHVFHFDRWWNPAVEDQATDRAFRIGQTRKVFVHKFVTLGTLEERIDRMIEDKKLVAGAIIGSDESWLTHLDNDAFRQLIALNRQAMVD